MCSCHSILECCVTFSGVKLSIRSFVLFLVDRIKAIVAFKLLDHWLADCYSLLRFQVMHFVLANRIKAAVAFKLLDHWLANS